MNKTYKGWELLKAIADGEIKEGSIIRNLITHREYKYEEDTCYYYTEEVGYRYLEEENNIKKLAITDFELISEPTEEIDIQSIKNVDTIYTRESNGANEILKFHTETREIINTLIQAIKQLDNKIKEEQ